MKHLILRYFQFLSFIGIILSAIWIVVEFLIYLFNDKPFNAWSISLFFSCIALTIVFWVLALIEKDNQAEKEIRNNGKSKFQERLEKLAKEKAKYN
jgi:Co/Zn/Cd efflux system component